MKKYLLILIIVLLKTIANGQTWAPIGAKWTFGIAWAFAPLIEYNEWISTCDTLVGGHTCKLIERNGGAVVSDISDKLITYEDSNKIYWYNTFINQFTVLYDFNKNAGDTWLMKIDTCDLLISVDSTGIEIINGFPVKVLWTSEGKMLQHIGNVHRPNPDMTYKCYGWIMDANYYTGLRCYEDSLLGLYDFGIAPSCDFTNSINDIANNPVRIKIYPNPFSNQTTVTTGEILKNATLTIFNSFGQQAGQIKNISGKTITLQRNNFASGLYFIQLTQDNKTFATEKLLITDY